jgi:hypothetical protein
MVALGKHMACAWAKSGVFAVAVWFFCLPTSAQQEPPPPTTPTVLQAPPQPRVFAHPDPLPSSPDAPVPDLGTLPTVPDPSKSRVRRKLEELMPRCLDGVIYVCWSLPGGVPPVPVSEAEREFAKDMEVGEINFKNGSYRGAEWRFRDALDYKPDNPEATFWLAKSIDKLGRSDEAQNAYRAYLQLQPNGTFAEKAQNALERLAKKSVKKK